MRVQSDGVGDAIVNEAEYYIQRVGFGDMITWWRAGQAGYTVEIEDAGIYHGDELDKVITELSIAWPVQYVRARARLHVTADHARAGAPPSEPTGLRSWVEKHVDHVVLVPVEETSLLGDAAVAWSTLEPNSITKLGAEIKPTPIERAYAIGESHDDPDRWGPIQYDASLLKTMVHFITHKCTVSQRRTGIERISAAAQRHRLHPDDVLGWLELAEIILRGEEAQDRGARIVREVRRVAATLTRVDEQLGVAPDAATPLGTVAAELTRLADQAEET